MILYNGTSSVLPFNKFDLSFTGSGLVCRGLTANGFFFTNDFQNAQYYTECGIVTIEIEDSVDVLYVPNMFELRKLENNTTQIIGVKNVLDGAKVSDIYYVPSNMLSVIKIINYTIDVTLDEDWLMQLVDWYSIRDKNCNVPIVVKGETFNSIDEVLIKFHNMTFSELFDKVWYCEECEENRMNGSEHYICECEE